MAAEEPSAKPSSDLKNSSRCKRSSSARSSSVGTYTEADGGLDAGDDGGRDEGGGGDDELDSALMPTQNLILHNHSNELRRRRSKSVLYFTDSRLKDGARRTNAVENVLPQR